MNYLKSNSLVRNVFFLLLLIPGFFLLACTAKEAETAKPATSTSSMAKEAVATEPAAKPVLDAGYLALFAKAKEDVANALSRNPGNFRAGQHYTELASSPVAATDKIEIIEFFSYGCGACFNAEPSMHAYAEQVADDVIFKRIPASFNPFFETLARGYYAANALGVDEEAHLAIFDAIHVKRRNLSTRKSLADFYASYGVDQDKFLKALDSFSVNSLIERDKKLAQSYQVSGVPTVIVNGAYNTGGAKAGTMAAWMQILDTLTQKVRAEK